MYKNLEQQPTFIYTEYSDVREVFVSDPERNKRKKNDVRENRTRYNITPALSTRHEDEEFPLTLSSSATSIIQRPSTVLMRNSPFQTCKRTHHSVGSINDPSDESRDHVYFWERKSQNQEDVEDKVSHRKQIRIMKELSAAKRERERRTEQEFLQFAKEFARKCRMRPIDSLLNPAQYDSFLQNAPSRDKTVSSFSHSKTDSTRSKISFVRSSSLIGLNPDDAGDVAGHVVGDLFSFASNMARYFDNSDLSDVILVIGEHRFHAHKFALAAQSEVFHEMLLIGNRCTSCPEFQKELDLNESKECQEVFSAFLRFFYCGKITFTSETALPLLVLSAKYRVEALRVACDAFITGMIEDGDLKNALRWLRYASVYQLHDLTSKCVDGAIADNIEELVETSDWLNMSADCVEAVLRSSSLLVPHEFFLFEALQRWLVNKRKSAADDELEECLRKTLPQLRFSQMQSSQLLAVEESSVGIQFKNVVRDHLSDAYRYQILSKDCPEFQEAQYLPRDYTEKAWCVQFYYNPTRNKRTSPSVSYGNGRWEIQPRKYYDTLNVVIILKKPLESDIKVYISIIIYKRNGSIHMRLRRKACVLRAMDTSPRPTALSGGMMSTSSTPANSPRSNSSSSSEPMKQKSNPLHNPLHPHRPPHGPANKLHGPNNGQEYYAIDNIISDGDFQVAMSNAVANGLKLGVIIRTWGANVV